MKKTKIICSIGPASSHPDVMEKMVNAGMNVARINFSHATLEERVGVLESVKEVRKRTGKNIAVLYDTRGPEFRSGMLENGEITLVEGNTIRVLKETIVGNENQISVNYGQAINDLKVGNVILLENGLMKIEVISVEEDGVTCKIVSGGVLGNKKSLSVPGVKLDIPFIDEIDREDIIYACLHEGDYLAASFVSSKADVLAIREIFKQNNREDMKIISKIESTTGIENLDEIIAVSDGIMVARGDLGVEAPMEQLPYFQKLIVKKCRENSKICVVATEMLESMKKSIRPTRAEVSDVANAVLDGADAVMLSGETTVGKYPVETVLNMANICEQTESYADFSKGYEFNRKNNIPEMIATSVVASANALEAELIIANTMSGYTARKISNLKPDCLVLATCTNEETAQSLALYYGVYPVVLPVYSTTEELVEASIKKAKELSLVNIGDTVVIASGLPNKCRLKATNQMKIEIICD